MNSKPPVGGTGGVQVKPGMYIDSHLERCLLVQIAELCIPGKPDPPKMCVLVKIRMYVLVYNDFNF